MDQAEKFTLPAGEVLALLHANGIGIRELAGGALRFSDGYFSVLGLEGVGITGAADMNAYRGLIHPDDRQAFSVAFTTARTCDTGACTVRYRLVGDGGTVWLRDHFFAAGLDRVLCMTENCQERVEQEEKLKGVEVQYRKLVNTLPNFVFVFDADFNFRDIIMPDAMTLLHPREELLRSNGRLIFTEEVSELYISNIRECLRSGHMKEIEYFLDINSVRYYFQARIVPFEDGKVFALIQDIGDRVRRMEELLAARRRAEEADRMKSAFLANMSHEIRTPLNAIVGFAEVLAMEDDPAVRAEYLDVIRSNNDIMLQLINDILDLSRIESGKLEMNFEQTDINMLVQEVWRSNEMKVKPGVVLRAEPMPDNIKVFTDRTRVMQVLFNFISNAIKNTTSGSIAIKVEEQGNHLRFSVTDTGRGIPAAKLSTIFGRFEKVDDFAQGTGLGLSISENLIERLGGEIGVESEVGKGSTFYFTLPYRIESGQTKIGNVKDAMLRRKKVLVAEDSDESYKIVEGVLGGTYDLVRARDGEQAVSAYVLEAPDLVLMNIQLPVMSGIEATQKIRAMSTRVPIIGVTANSFYMERQWARESGCNEIISKPYSPSKVEEVVLAFA